MADKDIFSMSDDDFDKLDLESSTQKETELTDENTDSKITNNDTTEKEVSNPDENNSTETNSPSGSEDEPNNEEVNKVDEPNTSEVNNSNTDEPNENSSEKPELGNQETTPTEDTDKLSWYEKLTKPFKANGQEFTVKSPEESIKLMQKGLNYTRKMQSLAADRKLAETFKAANITTPEDIGFLLDLKNGNKDAIKQLIKQYKIDPTDLVDYDLDEDSDKSSKSNAYTPTVPTPVSDQYLALKDHIAELSSQKNGSETINLVLKMDDESKQVIYQDPALMDSICAHLGDIRPSGISMYQEVVNEMERMKSLGELPPNTPFVYGYKMAGDRLYGTPGSQVNNQNNGYLGSSKVQPNQNVVNNNDSKVKQASIPRSGSVNKSIGKDVFAMTDEEFAKMSL